MKILGLDLGTSSIGWAIRNDELGDTNQITDSGVLVFPQGVGEEKGVEFSLASERTKHRSSRKLYHRRKQRKTDLLRLLIQNNMCPLTLEELSIWADYKKGRTQQYPTNNQDFVEWLAINPYEVRKKASEEKVTPKELGRALYHICQRRGFKSGRKDADAGKDVEVYKKEKEKRKDITLGAFQFQQLEEGKKVRKSKYKADDNEVNSSRISYVEEFNVLIAKQNVTKELSEQIHKAIFFQRPLKSQKGTIGKCTLEKNSPRCAVSHPLFEEFRMYQFLNSIKIRNTFGDKKFVFLSEHKEYYQIATNLFFRKSKPNFKFSDISRAINKVAKKKNEFFEFNYKDKYPIIGSPTIGQFINVFEAENWQDCQTKIQNAYKLSNEKPKDTNQLIDELWHTLFFGGNFTNDITSKAIKDFFRKRFTASEEQINNYEAISLKQGYAALSKKAIAKIVPYLHEKVLYSYAVFLANIDAVIGKEKWKENSVFIKDTVIDIIDNYQEENLKIDIINGLVGDFIKEYDNSDSNYKLDDTDKKNVTTKIISFFGNSRWNALSADEKEKLQVEIETIFEKQLQKRRFGGYYLSKPRLDEKIKQFLQSEFNVTKEQTEKLYHPSATEIYQDSTSGFLESPATSSVRNPMAMRTLYQLKKLINDLLKTNKINADTQIIIELARELNDKNKRLAIERYQREREKENNEFRKRLEEYQQKYSNYKIADIDIIKLRLWEEQDRKCIYTNKSIRIDDIIGENPKFEIEHTFPRSKSFDNSLVNKTLCDKYYNQKIKGNKIPFELKSDYQTILNNVYHFREEAEELKTKIEQQKYFAKVAITKEQKDRAIQQRHYLQLHYNYRNEKYKRFTEEEIHPKFKNSQLVDTGVITKYAKLYLQTLFKKVFPAKGTMVADVRQSWGLPKKDRDYHYHHAIDAMVLTCMTKDIRDGLAYAFHQSEDDGDELKFKIPKLWRTFTQDILEEQKNILVVHHHKNTLLKQTKRKLRKRHKIQRNKNGEIIYQIGQGIRASLHKDTFYGAIERENEKGKKEIKYVVRKPVSNIKEADIKNIVDEGIKERIAKHGLKNVRKDNGFIVLPAENGKKEMMIKRIRLKTALKKKLPIIKKQSHVSQKGKKEYKENYYATLENIFAMAVYETGKPTKVSKTISAFDVAQFNKGRRTLEIPVEKNYLDNSGDKNIFPLKYVLKVHKSVLFYKNSADELKSFTKLELSNRLYKIVNFESDGRIQLRHHAIAMKKSSTNKAEMTITKLMKQKGLKEAEINFDKPNPWLRLRLSKFYALIEGVDFTISPSGEIDFKVN